MFKRKTTPTPHPTPTKAAAAAPMQVDASGGAAADQFMQQLNKQIGDGLNAPKRKLRPKRVLAAPNPDFPELDYLEEKSQSAAESQLDALWLENNADFHYCDMHQQVCEMIANHPEDHYNIECQKCLKKGGLMEMFFQREGMNLTMPQAREAWQSYRDRQVEVHKQLMTSPSGNRPLQKQFDLRERAAFLRYSFLAWEKNKARVQAVKEHAARPGQSAAFNLLPSTADEELCAFVNDATMRNMRTNSGMQGKSCNVKPCDMHDDGDESHMRRGHAIQIFNKHRYHECGICYRTREQTQTQREADTYDNSASAEERPQIRFGASQKLRFGAAAAAASSSMQ